MPGSEVKGAWFMTARRYILEDFGEEIFARYIEATPEASRDALADPVVSRWYPETVMRDALESFYREVSHRDADKKAPLTLALSAPPPFSLAVQQLVVHDLVLGGPRRFHDSSIGSVGPGKGNT